MRDASLAALAMTLAYAVPAAAGEPPSHDPAIEAAAIAILQRKLPEMRPSHGIDARPRLPPEAKRGKGLSVLRYPDEKTPLPARISWL